MDEVTRTIDSGVGLRAVALAVATLVLVAGCSGSGQAVATNEVAATLRSLQAQGKLPTLDVTNSVGGGDANGNGVRDDLDAYIAAQGDTAAQKAALTQLAKALQATLLVDTTNQAALATAATGLNRGVACIWTAYADDVAPGKVHVLQQLTVNTLTRLTAYETFNEAMDGTVAQLPAGTTCDA